MLSIRQSISAVAVLATVAMVWWLDAPLAADPVADYRQETTAARRERLEAILDREVHVEALREPLGQVLERLCQSAGLRAKFLTREPPLTRFPFTVEDPLLRDWRVTIALPHPIRLRAALGLLAPHTAWVIDGDELQIACSRKELVTALRTYPLPFPSDALPLLSSAFQGEVHRSLRFEGGLHIRDDADLLWSPRYCRAREEERQVYATTHEPVDLLQDLLTTLQGMADGRITTPVQIGETAAGCVKRIALEQALARVIEVDLPPTRLTDALGEIQDQLGVNFHLDQRALEDEGIDTQALVALNTRLPARSVLRHLLRPLKLVVLVEHDVILVTTEVKAEEHLSLRAYPVAHLFRPENSWQTYELTDAVCSLVEPAHWDGMGGRGDLFVVERSALVVYQTEQAHAEIERILALLATGLDAGCWITTSRQTAPPPADSMEQALQQPAAPLAGPLTLEELIQHLRSRLGSRVLLELAEIEEEGYLSVSHPDASGLEPWSRIVFAGDAGHGSLAEQLQRLGSQTRGCGFMVQDDALLVTSARGSYRETVEYYSLPKVVDQRVLSPYLHQPRTPGGSEFVTALLVHAMFGHARLRNPISGADPPGGLLVRQDAASHTETRRLLTPGNPVHTLLAQYAWAHPRQRNALLDTALRSGDTDLTSLAIWLVDYENTLPLRHALIAALRSGVLLGPEFKDAPQVFCELWSQLAVVQAPPEELAQAIAELGASAPLAHPLMELLERACIHPDVEVRRAALVAIAGLPARGECALHFKPVLANLDDPELAPQALAAIEAHAAYWAQQLGKWPGAFNRLFELQPRFPRANELIKAYFIDQQVPWDNNFTRDYPGMVEVLLEMLTDSRPEYRKYACEALGWMAKPTRTTYRRIHEMTADPLVGAVAQERVDHWKRYPIHIPTE